MSTITDAIEIIDHLQTDGISRETAKELIDYVDKRRGELATKQDTREAIRPLWVVMMAGFAALLSVMIYLHSDTKAEMNRRFVEQKAEMKELKAEMKEIKELLQRGQR